MVYNEFLNCSSDSISLIALIILVGLRILETSFQSLQLPKCGACLEKKEVYDLVLIDFSYHLLPLLGFKPTSVELHRPCTLCRTLYQLSHRAGANLFKLGSAR